MLDTGLLIHALRGSPAFTVIDKNLGLTARGFRPVISIISQGELLGFSKKRKWGAGKVSGLSNLLQNVVIIPIDQDRIADTYSDLEYQNISNGLNLGQNDLWIAATSIEYGLQILTFDGDFERAPKTVKYIRFDQDNGDELSRN